MSNDVIGSRYRLGSVVTCTPEATTWDALDSWLDERVLVVTPEPGCDERFAALAGAVLDRSSAHLVGLYDIGATTRDFVVFGMPTATLSDERAPREEEDVLVAGRALGDALEALHERGVLHGDLHPGSVVVAESGDAALSPWPLAPRPHNWSGPGGFGTDPDELRDISARDDVRALGAVLLGALAGPPVLSSQQIGNLERELAERAPDAVTIADRALTSPARGGYAVAADLRDDCAAVLAGRSVATPVSHAHAAAGDAAVADGAGASDSSEGRRAAMVLAASGAALLAAFGVAGGLGASPHPPVHAGAAHASGCAARPALPRCVGRDRADIAADAAQPVAGVTARLTDQPVAAAPPPGPAAPARVATSTPATSATGPTRSAAPPTTTAPPSTTTSSSTSTSTTTTSAAPTTTTTTTPATTTSTSSNVVQAGPSLGGGSWSGSGGAPGPVSGR